MTQIEMSPDAATAESSRMTMFRTPCVHGRLIDDVRTSSGKRTGKVRCLECGTIFDDPYQGSK